MYETLITKFSLREVEALAAFHATRENPVDDDDLAQRQTCETMHEPRMADSCKITLRCPQ